MCKCGSDQGRIGDFCELSMDRNVLRLAPLVDEGSVEGKERRGQAVHGKKPSRRDFAIERHGLLGGSGPAEEEVGCPRQPVDGLVRRDMVDHINRDAALLKSLPDGRHLRRLSNLDATARKDPDGHVASLHEKNGLGRGEDDGKGGVLHKAVLLRGFLVP